jgi:hypothetical protein
MRLVECGGRIELHPRVKGTHLKHWDLRNMVRTDFLLRGIPWVELMLERRSAPTTLNLSWSERASTILTALIVPAALLRRPRVVAGLSVAVGGMNGRFYWILMRRMGLIRGAVGIALHALHRMVAVASVPAGVLSHLRRVARAGGAK